MQSVICESGWRQQSAVFGLDTVDDMHTRNSLTGVYDLSGTLVFREGGLLAESVHPFQGQSASATIFTEVVAEIDELVFRKLFVDDAGAVEAGAGVE